MTLKQEVDSKFAIVMKEADQSLMKMKQEFYSEYVYKLQQHRYFTRLGTLFTSLKHMQWLCIESYMHVHVQVTFIKKELVHSKYCLQQQSYVVNVKSPLNCNTANHILALKQLNSEQGLIIGNRVRLGIKLLKIFSYAVSKFHKYLKWRTG